MSEMSGYDAYLDDEATESLTVDADVLVIDVNDLSPIDDGGSEDVEQGMIEEAAEAGAESSTAVTCIRVDLLKIKNWPEFKVGVRKKCYKVLGRRVCHNVPQAYQRNCELRAYAKICHPKAEQMKQFVIKAVREAVAAGVVVGVVTGNVAAATEALKQYLIAKLASKLSPINKITVKVDTEKKCGDWKPR